MRAFCHGSFDCGGAGDAAEGFDDLITAGRSCVVMIASGFILVAAAFVEVIGRFAIAIEVSVDGKSIEGVAYHGGVLVGLGDLFGFPSGGVVVVAGMRIHVAATVIERSDGMGGDDHVDGCGRVEADAIEGDSDGTALELSGGVVENRFYGDHVGGFDGWIPLGISLDYVVFVFWINVGAGGGFEGFLGFGDSDRAVIADDIPFGVVVKFGEICEEGAVEIIDLAVLEPDTAFVFAVGHEFGAPGTHPMFGGLGFRFENVAKGSAAVGEGTLFGFDFANEVLYDEEGGIEPDGFRSGGLIRRDKLQGLGFGLGMVTVSASWAAGAWPAISTRSTWATARRSSGSATFGADGRGAAVGSENDRPFVGEEVGVGTIGKLGGDGETTIAFIECARAFDIFVIRGERSVVSSTRSLGSTRAIAGFQLEARCHFHDFRLGILRIGIAVERIDGEAIKGPSDKRGVGVMGEFDVFQKSGGLSMVVIFPGGLDVGVVFIQAEIDGSAKRLVVPWLAGAASPELAGACFQEDAVEKDAYCGSGRDGFVARLGFERKF